MRFLLVLLAYFAISLVSLQAHQNKIYVVTSISPLNNLAKGVGGEHVETFSLVSGGGSPHFVQMRKSFIEKVRAADFVLTIGEALEPSIDKTLSQLSLKEKWTRLSRLPGLEKHKAQSNCCGIDEKMKKKHPALLYDQHMWLSPLNARLLVGWLVRHFSKKQPKLKEIFQANGAKLTKEIHDAERDCQQQLAPYKKKPFVVLHDGYQYFVKYFGLRQEGIILTSGEGARPTHLITLIEDMKKKGVKCIFKEAQLPSPMAHKVARQTEGTVATLDPLGGESYAALIKSLTQTMIACFQEVEEKELEKGGAS